MSTHNPIISSREIARLIDISAVRADSTRQDVEDIIDGAIKHNFICVFPMPSMLLLVFEKLKDHPQIGIGGVVGFPSGGETTASKLFQAKELKEAGCNEIDMVLNIGKLKSGMLNDIEDEIREIKAAVSPLPLKVIMEVVLLTDEEIKTASSIILKAGADYIKTGTGESNYAPSYRSDQRDRRRRHQIKSGGRRPHARHVAGNVSNGRQPFRYWL